MACGEKAMRPDRYGGMICACGPEGKETQKELRQWVLNHLDVKDGPFLLSQVVMALVWNHEAYVEAIHADMWFGMETKSETYSAWVEADFLEDAFFQTLKAFVEKPVVENGKLQEKET